MHPHRQQHKHEHEQFGLRILIRQQQLVVKVVVVAVVGATLDGLVLRFWKPCRIFLSRLAVVMLSMSLTKRERWRMKSGYSSRLQWLPPLIHKGS